MTENLSISQQFLKDLDACQTKQDLLQLACFSLRRSTSQRGLEQRRLKDWIVCEPIVHLLRVKARDGLKFTCDDKLKMIMARYDKFPNGSPLQFHEDFKQAYPQEYFMKNEKNIGVRFAPKQSSAAFNMAMQTVHLISH